MPRGSHCAYSLDAMEPGDRQADAEVGIAPLPTGPGWISLGDTPSSPRITFSRWEIKDPTPAPTHLFMYKQVNSTDGVGFHKYLQQNFLKNDANQTTPQERHACRGSWEALEGRGQGHGRD